MSRGGRSTQCSGVTVETGHWGEEKENWLTTSEPIGNQWIATCVYILSIRCLYQKHSRYFCLTPFVREYNTINRSMQVFDPFTCWACSSSGLVLTCFSSWAITSFILWRTAERRNAQWKCQLYTYCTRKSVEEPKLIPAQFFHHKIGNTETVK